MFVIVFVVEHVFCFVLMVFVVVNALPKDFVLFVIVCFNVSANEIVNVFFSCVCFLYLCVCAIAFGVRAFVIVFVFVIERVII